MNTEHRVTIRDVARLAGVSKSTVSLVLNGGAGVAENTAARVRGMIDATGYAPDRRALRFRNKRPGPVGIVLSSAPDAPTADLLAGLSDRLRTDGQTMLVSIDADVARAASTLCEEGASAVVIEGWPSGQAPPDCPVIFLHAGAKDAARIRIDADQALRLAARSAQRSGAKRVLVIGSLPAMSEVIPDAVAGVPFHHCPLGAFKIAPEDLVLCSARIAPRLVPQLGIERVLVLGADDTASDMAQLRWDAQAAGVGLGEVLLDRIAGKPATVRDIVVPVWLSLPALSKAA